MELQADTTGSQLVRNFLLYKHNISFTLVLCYMSIYLISYSLNIKLELFRLELLNLRR